jgi:hypothetical protein
MVVNSPKITAADDPAVVQPKNSKEILDRITRIKHDHLLPVRFTHGDIKI